MDLLLSLLSRYLELIAPHIVDSRLRAVLSVERAYTMAESDAALQFIQQYALVILHDGLSVGTFLQVRTNLCHDVRVERFQQHPVGPSLIACLKILKHEGQSLPLSPLRGARPYRQHPTDSSFKFHIFNILMIEY
jgi:hypothetical protein